MKIDVQLPSGYSTLKWVLEFGITVKNGSCACVGSIPGLHLCSLFSFRGQSGLQSSGAGGGWWMAGRGPFPPPPCPQAQGAPAGAGQSPAAAAAGRHSPSSALPASSFSCVTPAGCFHREGEERVERYREAGSWDRRDAETVMCGGSLSCSQWKNSICCVLGGRRNNPSCLWLLKMYLLITGKLDLRTFKGPFQNWLIVIYSSVVCICFPSALSLICPYLGSQLTTLSLQAWNNNTVFSSRVQKDFFS